MHKKDFHLQHHILNSNRMELEYKDFQVHLEFLGESLFEILLFFFMNGNRENITLNTTEENIIIYVLITGYGNNFFPIIRRKSKNVVECCFITYSCNTIATIICISSISIWTITNSIMIYSFAFCIKTTCT